MRIYRYGKDRNDRKRKDNHVGAIPQSKYCEAPFIFYKVISLVNHHVIEKPNHFKSSDSTSSLLWLFWIWNGQSWCTSIFTTAIIRRHFSLNYTHCNRYIGRYNRFLRLKRNDDLHRHVYL